MECATIPPLRTSSNVSEIVSKLAKVCRFRSIGVFPSEKSEHYQYHQCDIAAAEDCNGVKDEAECDGQKVHPQPNEILSKPYVCANFEILKLFDTISALKLAYVRLQEAHIPYDPDKIIAADELVVSQLEELCRIKRAYKENRSKFVTSISACSALLLAEIQVQERLLGKLKSQMKVKSAAILSLRSQLEDLDLQNNKMVEELRHEEIKIVKVQNLSPFEEIVKAASKAIHEFSKPLISLMKASGWDLDRAVNLIEESVVYSKRSHKKYAFEAYIARRMFHGISLEPDNFDTTSSFDDPLDALIKDPDSSFAKFCRAKYISVVHPKIEASFFGNLDHRTFVSSGGHPRTPFYHAFVKMAWQIWFLQGTATSNEAEIFRVMKGSEFSDVYMDCVEELKKEMVLLDGERSKFKVEFMVMPGFRVGEKVIRSQVYLSKMRS